MNIKIFNPEHFLTSEWSGGSTTQLYIFPSHTTYATRDFNLRISTARVLSEVSTFTQLPGIDRKLMVLEGGITITHEGHYKKTLIPFEVDHFSGDWKTTAIGTCTDFNVMTMGKQKSDLYYLSLKAITDHILKSKTACKTLFLNVISGNLYLQIKDENYRLETGSLMMIEDLGESAIVMNSPSNSGLVILEI